MSKNNGSPPMTEQPKFRLFRLTSPMHNGCTHAGEVWIHNRMYTLTAKVVETQFGKQFHGYVDAPGESITKSLSASGRADYQQRKLRKNLETPGPAGSTADLVAQAEGAPFDDPLPPLPSPTAGDQA